MSAKEILDFVQKRTVEIRDRGNLRDATHHIADARADWYAANILDELIADIKKIDPKLPGATT